VSTNRSRPSSTQPPSKKQWAVTPPKSQRVC